MSRATRHLSPPRLNECFTAKLRIYTNWISQLRECARGCTRCTLRFGEPRVQFRGRICKWSRVNRSTRGITVTLTPSRTRQLGRVCLAVTVNSVEMARPLSKLQVSPSQKQRACLALIYMARFAYHAWNVYVIFDFCAFNLKNLSKRTFCPLEL